MYDTAKNAYKDVEIDSIIEGGDALGLVRLLYDLLTSEIDCAIDAMKDNNIELKGQKLGRCIAIVHTLHSALEFEQNAELVENFSAIYDWMRRHLLEAVRSHKTSGLENILGVARELGNAWHNLKVD